MTFLLAGLLGPGAKTLRQRRGNGQRGTAPLETGAERWMARAAMEGRGSGPAA